MTKTTEQLFQEAIDSLQALKQAIGTEAADGIIEQVQNLQPVVTDKQQADVERMIEFMSWQMQQAQVTGDDDKFYDMKFVIGFGSELIILDNCAATYNAVFDALAVIKNDRL